MKNETKHTHGPWHFEKRQSFGNFYEVRAGSRGVGCLVSAGSEEETRANAALIAASPELLEVLENVTYNLEECAELSGHLSVFGQSIDKARAAIEKAKGN